jgi:hypothetical protein
MYEIEIIIETENKQWGESFKNCRLEDIAPLVENELKQVTTKVIDIRVQIYPMEG